MISAQFLQSLSAGDEDAIQTLVRAYQRPVFQLALSILDDGVGTETSPETITEAEAVVQDTFMTAIDRLNRYRSDGGFETWLYALAIDASRKRARRMKSLFRRFRPGDRAVGNKSFSPLHFSSTGAAEAKSAPAPLGPAVGTLADDQIWQAIRQLDLKLRLPVVLRYYHDFPVETVARILRLSEGAVHARLDAAREKIAGNLEA